MKDQCTLTTNPYPLNTAISSTSPKELKSSRRSFSLTLSGRLPTYNLVDIVGVSFEFFEMGKTIRNAPPLELADKLCNSTKISSRARARSYNIQTISGNYLNARK